MVKCLATDSETGGIGCDNMTVVVVALLNGRTPEEWRQWVKERVENKGVFRDVVPSLTTVGHDTPESVPDIFGQNQGGSNAGGFGGGFGGAGFRIAGAGGLQNLNLSSILGASGISFRPPEDSDDEEDDGELHIIGGDEGAEGSKISVVDEEEEEDADYLDDKGIKKGTKPVDVTDKLASCLSCGTSGG
jgi:protein phosphatase 2C family protein 2/3